MSRQGAPARPPVRLRARMAGGRGRPAGSVAEAAARWLRTRWDREVRARIKKSHPEYKAAMNVLVTGPTKLTITLGAGRGNFSIGSAIEQGMPSFDMKKGLLKGGREFRRIPLDPRYRRQPFATVSKKSATDSWRHPGIKAHGALEATLDAVEKELLPAITKDLMNEIGTWLAEDMKEDRP